MKTINVAIADNQVLFRKGMISIVNSFENIQIILEVDNGKALIEAIEAAEVKLDIVLFINART